MFVISKSKLNFKTEACKHVLLAVNYLCSLILRKTKLVLWNDLAS